MLAAIADLSRAVEVACGGWERLSRDQREDAYLELERARKKLAIVDAQYVQARNEDLWCSDARLPASLAKRQRISKAEARRRRIRISRSWSSMSMLMIWMRWLRCCGRCWASMIRIPMLIASGLVGCGWVRRAMMG